MNEDLRSEINTTTSAINTECETCPPRICASTSLTLPSSYPLLSSKDLFSRCKKPLFPSVFLFSTRALCNSPVLPLLCFSEVAERVRERERAADSGRERHGDRKEGGYASMWGRVALQSLAKIAVTHYYTDTHTHLCCGIQGTMVGGGWGGEKIMKPKSRTLVGGHKEKILPVLSS